MHEVSICQSIVGTLEAELDESKFREVREVHVKIGVLTCVDPKILAHVFSYIIEGSPFEKSSLHPSYVETVAACEQCKEHFKVHDYRFVCPICDTPSTTIVAGNE